MVRLNKIYTSGGDEGMTSLGDKSRISKCSLRIHVIGNVDELNAILGIARFYLNDEFAKEVKIIQNNLFDLGADLSVPSKLNDDSQKKIRIGLQQSKYLENKIDFLNKNLSNLESFVFPGGNIAAAHIHHARTVTRRAERYFSKLAMNEKINKNALKYLSRLSDYLFVLARIINDQDKYNNDILWIPGNYKDI